MLGQQIQMSRCFYSECLWSRWQVGEQGPCSVSCDLGVALRTVSCVQFDGKLEREVEDEHCEVGKKPPLTVPCFTQACSFHWGVQEWSEVNFLLVLSQQNLEISSSTKMLLPFPKYIPVGELSLRTLRYE